MLRINLIQLWIKDSLKLKIKEIPNKTSELDLLELTILTLFKCPLELFITKIGNPSEPMFPEWLNVLVLDKDAPVDAVTVPMYYNAHVLLKLLAPLV